MLKIDVFGPLRVQSGSLRLGAQDFQGSKPKQLLEILASAAGHGMSKESLADRLWGDRPPLKYLATLETYVSVLRRTIEPGVRVGNSLIMTERGGYRLDADGVELDLDCFDHLLAMAAVAPPAAALPQLDQALALIRGAVLEDEPYAPWANELRTTYLPRQVQALVSAGQLNLLTGDASTALARAAAAVELNPLSEAAYQVQMTAAYALWRQDEALAAFDRCRRLLGEELGVDPMDKTVALHLAILRHEDLASMLPRVTPAQVPPTAVQVRPALPAPPELLAREHELDQFRGACDRARNGKFTLVLVTGEQGIGKTSLIEEATRQAGLPVGSNRCSDLEQELPYLSLAMALRSLPDGPANSLPVLDTLLTSTEPDVPFDGFARLRVMERLATWVGAQPPLMLVLDDVQWADAETLRTVGYLHRRCSKAAVVVVLGCDKAALSAPALRALHVDLRVDLGVLPQSAVPDEQVYALTGGHPLFLAGWAAARSRGLRESFPPELRERIVMGCWDLGPQAFQLLSVCCAVEQPVSPALLATLVGVSAGAVAEELDRLVDKGVLDAVDEGFAFRSPAVRSILWETLSPARRSLLREQAAAALTRPRRRTTDAAAGQPPPADRQRRSTDLLPQRPDLALALALA